jgi:ribosomal protein L7/L12
MPTTFKVEYAFHGTTASDTRFLSFDTKIEAQAAERALSATHPVLALLSIKEIATLNGKEFSPVELETFRFLAQTDMPFKGSGRVQAIKLIRYLSQSGLKEARDFLEELCPRPNQEPNVPGYPDSLCVDFPGSQGVSNMTHVGGLDLPKGGPTEEEAIARETIISALILDRVSSYNSLGQSEYIKALLRTGHPGYQNMENQVLLDMITDEGLQDTPTIQQALKALQQSA